MLENENIALPLFNEQILASEVYFEPQLVGLQEQSVDEMVKEFSRTFGIKDVVIGGVGAKLRGIADRLGEEVKRIGCTVRKGNVGEHFQ